MSPMSSLERMPELWFEEGTLVFQAENSLFRVYSEILSKQSSVFRDMLSFPQPPAEESDIVEGCPRIVLHDKAADVTAFFRAIYDSSFFVPPFTPPLDMLAGILRLSIKYDVDYLRRRCLGHLSDMYPTTLKAWDRLGYSRDIINLRAPPDVYPVFHILDFLKEFEAPWLVPAIMYLGCSNPIQRILDGVALGGPAELTPEKRALLIAYPEQALSVESVLRFLKQRFPGCRAPEKCNTELLQLSVFIAENWGACRFPLEIWEEGDWEVVAGDLCSECIGQCRKMHAKGRQGFWDRMPTIFGLNCKWSELEKLKKAALNP
ncbi:hypothetical protein C8R45DRAFT_1165462 [Mycena sanguinolenta]|nr:hypothetical protein C8R45DRAFT_1165462 [Mycena sanguinolenta]